MKILLINPPYRRLRRVGSVYFPIGLGYLAGVLEKAGYEVKIYNGEVPRAKDEQKKNKYKGGDFSHIMFSHQEYIKNLEDDNFFVWQEFKKSLNDFKPDLVGVSVRTPMLGSAEKISRFVKEWNKNCFVVWGGSHSTIMPEESLKNSNIDYLVSGEGENVLLDLVKTLENSGDVSKVKGLYYKNNQAEIIKNSCTKFIQNLDEVPFPARHLVFEEDLYPEGSMQDVMGSRGCPFLCSYCSAQSSWGRKGRFRSIKNIIEEVKILRDKYGCDYLRFMDDTITIKRDWIEELCREMIKQKIGVKWACLTRVDRIDEKLLKLMIKAGCYRVDVGVESGSPRILKKLKKGITLEQVKKSDRLFNKYGIDWTAFFITGLPYETKEDLQATAKFMKVINPYRMVLSNFTPYPATKDYERTKTLGMLPDKIDWSLLDHNSPDNFFMKHVDRGYYQKFFQELSDYVSMRNTHRIRGREIYYLKHPIDFLRKVKEFIKKRI